MLSQKAHFKAIQGDSSGQFHVVTSGFQIAVQEALGMKVMALI
jgi:hypothetical protein